MKSKLGEQGIAHILNVEDCPKKLERKLRTLCGQGASNLEGEKGEEEACETREGPPIRRVQETAHAIERLISKHRGIPRHVPHENIASELAVQCDWQTDLATKILR